MQRENKQNKIPNLQRGSNESGRAGGINTGSDIHPDAKSNMDGRTSIAHKDEIEQSNNEFDDITNN